MTGKETISGQGSFQASAPSPPVISPVTPPAGTVSTVYSFLIPVSGGVPPYSCTVAGTLPALLAISTASGNQGCLISGTLSINSGGTYTGISVTVTDSVGGHATSSPPYTITIFQPQSLGPPRYLGAVTGNQAIQLPATLPIMGPNACPGNPLPCYTLGTGTIINDPSFNPSVPTTVVRISDANTECGPRNGFTQAMDVGGSGDANMVASDDRHFIINDQGNAYLMFAFDPNSFAVTPMYPSIYGCPGGRGVLNVPGGEWSYGNPNLYYGIQSASSCAATTCPNPTSVTQIDISSPVAPVFTPVFDFKNCLPPTALIAPSWTSQGGVDTSDRFFAQAASLTGGGQNTGGDQMFFDRQTQTCYLYDTIGNVDPARQAIGLTGVSVVYTKADQKVIFTVPNTFTSGQILYMIGITGTMNILNGLSITLTATSTSTITGTIIPTAKLGHADASGTVAGPSCVGVPTVQCPNIGTMEPAIYTFVGPSWNMNFLGYVSSAVGSFTIHNDKISKDGSFVVTARENCLSVCMFNLQINYWFPEAVTPKVCLYNDNGGHWTGGNNVWVNLGSSAVPYLSWEGFPACSPPLPQPPLTNQNVCTSAKPNPGNAQCLVFPIPATCNASLTAPVPCIKNYDGHPNWNTNNPTFRSTWGFQPDTTPISTTMYSSQWVYPAPFFGPQINEVDIVNTCVFASPLAPGCNPLGNAMLREGHTYNTALNGHFDTQFEIGAGSSTGKFYFYSTDHGGQFGQQPQAGVFVTINNAAVAGLLGTFKYPNPPIAGVVNTTTSGFTVTWVSGTKFNLAWTGTITINAVPYTIATVASATSLTLTTDPGNQSSKAYSFPTSPILTTGKQVALYGFLPPLDVLNGQYVTVLSSGLTNTQFQANLPAGTPNVSAGAVSGTSATVVSCLPGALLNCRGDVEMMVLK